MYLILQETKVQVQVLKPCKSVQETNEEVLDFKTPQLVSIKVKRLLKPDSRQLFDR